MTQIWTDRMKNKDRQIKEIQKNVRKENAPNLKLFRFS